MVPAKAAMKRKLISCVRCWLSAVITPVPAPLLLRLPAPLMVLPMVLVPLVLVKATLALALDNTKELPAAPKEPPVPMARLRALCTVVVPANALLLPVRVSVPAPACCNSPEPLKTALLVVALHYLALGLGCWRLARCWFWLGLPAFSAMLLVVALMVFKHIPGATL